MFLFKELEGKCNVIPLIHVAYRSEWLVFFSFQPWFSEKFAKVQINLF